MSNKVKERLRRLGIEMAHLDRQDFDRIIEQISGKTCDEAIDVVSDIQIRRAVETIKRKKKRVMEIVA